MSNNHCMIDMETLDTCPDTTILTIGLVRFDPFGDDKKGDKKDNEKLYMRFEIDPQLDMGRTVSDSTIAWWGQQNPKVMAEAFDDGDDRIPLENGLKEISKFMRNCTYPWGHGSIFDIAILENAYRQVKEPIPWQFWNIRDTRTLFDLVDDPEMPKDANKHHHALEDAIRQVIGVQNCYKKLDIKK